MSQSSKPSDEMIEFLVVFKNHLTLEITKMSSNGCLSALLALERILDDSMKSMGWDK